MTMFMDKRGRDCSVTEVNFWIIIEMGFECKDWRDRIEGIVSRRMMGCIPSPYRRDRELWRKRVNRTSDGGDHRMESVLRWSPQDDTVWTIMVHMK